VKIFMFLVVSYFIEEWGFGWFGEFLTGEEGKESK
jgi:hypothetical protein